MSISELVTPADHPATAIRTPTAGGVAGAQTSVIAAGAAVGAVGTVANAITLVRTIAAVVVAGVAISADRPGLLAAAYAIYWVGDILDGFAARRLGEESRLGAVFDIISDRACTSILCIGLLAHLPGLAPVAVPFFVSFMVLDTMLSLSFLCFDVISPNYFAQVDRRVYKLNWSPPAKALNTAGVIILALLGAIWSALGLTLVLVGIKIWSLVRVLRLIDGAGR
ncbi:CDP-alcohol phosphatidyltransferase family protein [Nocardioides acrostichi]|uniref:CDP-alcohol phosphatidyltransferase family protein n=1 Tax=Nocardioides acrostichi TaxID=2784339 RepID=A0A930Y661_9ACTN|nr:CDP-alcohol phosphatidyltransferase family protein [Nocardioides acrostichi]MBF4160596.1 CDP-alcohol phosphatidyltransferase family protein [Nocardioides acrostichi]